MNLEVASEPTIENDQPESSLPFPKFWWGRALYGAYVVLMPILAFWSARLAEPDWQSGKISDYIALLLHPKASLLFFALLAYSVLCYLLLLFAPARYARWFFVRWGIYTGVVLAFQYSVLINLFLFTPYFTLLWVLPIAAEFLYRRDVRKWGTKAGKAANTALLWLALVTVAFLVIFALTESEALFFCVAIMIIPAPIWSFLLAVRAAIWLFKNYEGKLRLPQGLGIAGWLGAYLVAWRFDILKMYEMYSALPTEPPCYIATAAARGHPKFVGAWTVQYANGKSMQVNEQLQRLKCAELALMAVQPSLHRWIRKIYDVVGKSLARQIQNPFLADAAYLLLKPWEWLAGLVLKIIVPEIDSLAQKLYADR